MHPPTGLIPWFSKTEGNTYATLLHHPFLFKEIQRSAQEVAKISKKDIIKMINNMMQPQFHFYVVLFYKPN